MNIYSENDRNVLRDLAKRVAEIADDLSMDKRRKMWVEHNSLRSKYPMMLIFPEGSWGEIMPEKSLTCTGDARWVEAELRRRKWRRSARNSTMNSSCNNGTF